MFLIDSLAELSTETAVTVMHFVRLPQNPTASSEPRKQVCVPLHLAASAAVDLMLSSLLLVLFVRNMRAKAAASRKSGVHQVLASYLAVFITSGALVTLLQVVTLGLWLLYVFSHRDEGSSDQVVQTQ